MDCKEWSEFQLVEEHSMSKNRTEEREAACQTEGKVGSRGAHITNSEFPGDEAVLKGESGSFRGRREFDGILVWFLEAGCRIMDVLAYETRDLWSSNNRGSVLLLFWGMGREMQML